MLEYVPSSDTASCIFVNLEHHEYQILKQNLNDAKSQNPVGIGDNILHTIGILKPRSSQNCAK